MKFPWRIIGHTHLLQKLEYEYEHKKIAQSYLFCGPQEIGKFTVAKTFAQLLQCTQHNLCRNCTACSAFEKNIHSGVTIVDRLWIQDVNENLEELASSSTFDQSHRKKSKKKSNQIGVEDVNVFTASLWTTSNSRFKICLIDNMQRMTTEAMNTFLKILEEPPEKTIFLLTAPHKESLLPTIISRVRTIEMGLIPNTILRQQFSALSDLSSQEQEEIITLAQGRPGRFFRLLHDAEFLQQQKQLFTEISHLLKNKNISTSLHMAEKLSKKEARAELFDFFDALLHFLRTLLREKAEEKSLSLGSMYSYQNMITLLEKTEQTKQRILKNSNPRLALEELFLLL